MNEWRPVSGPLDGDAIDPSAGGLDHNTLASQGLAPGRCGRIIGLGKIYSGSLPGSLNEEMESC